MRKTAEILTIPQAAVLKGVTRQAMHAAVKTGRVKTVKVKVEQVGIRLEDLAEFQPDYERQARASNHTR